MQHSASVGPYGVPGNSDSLHGLIPRGLISMWSGLLSQIPVGWALCDGTLGTPNLVAKFLRGINTATTEPGTTGGSDTRTPAGTNSAPTFTGSAMGTHDHEMPMQFNASTARNTTASIGTGSTVASQIDWGLSTETNSRARQKVTAVSAGTPAGSVSAPTFTGTSLDVRPAYYEVAFIMKL